MSQVSFMERLPTITSSNACIMQAWCFFVFKQGMVLKVSIIACCSSAGVNEDHVVIQGEERSTMDAQEAGYSIPALKRQVGRGWWLQMVVCLLLSSESAPQLCNISGRFLESQNFFLGCSKFFFFNKYQSIIETFVHYFLHRVCQQQDCHQYMQRRIWLIWCGQITIDLTHPLRG